MTSPCSGSSVAVTQHNLPTPISSFVGRGQSIEEALDRLKRCRLLTLTGTGGVGKTRLAIELAWRRLPVMPDGVQLIELAPIADGRLVSHAVAAPFGLIDVSSRTLADVLRTRHLLLVLDNCEHVAAACAELVEALLHACPKLQVLATSREALGIVGEQLIIVPPLPALEARQLFVERARAVVPKVMMSAAVDEICARLDGIPLAIELAAARVRTLAPEQIAERLDDRLGLLVGTSRTAPSRHHTLRAALAWSYDLLDERDRLLLEQLSVFPGGCTLEAAEAVCDGPDVLAGLERLVDRSLISAEQGRYRMLETVRQFAAEQLAGRDALEQLRERHARYWLALVERAEPELKRIDQATWFSQLEAEHDNLRAALRWALEACRADIGLSIAVALQRFWEVRGHWTEAVRWMTDLIALRGSHGLVARLMARSITYMGVFDQSRGDNETARPLLEDGLVLAESARDPATVAYALHGLGQLVEWQGHLDIARPLLERSLELARKLDDGWATARVLCNLGNIARANRDFVQARALMAEGLAIAQRVGERRIASTLMRALASVELVTGELDRSETLLLSALTIKRELGDRYGESMVDRALGSIAYERRDYRLACEHFGRVLAITRHLGNYQERSVALIGFASLAAHLGDDELAVALWAATERMRVASGWPEVETISPRHRPAVEAARARLGAATADAAWAKGWELSADEIEALVTQITRAYERPARAEFPNGLTAREVEVLRLLVSGKSDREIAADLVLSDKTVGRHLEHIYAKLGLSSRAAASAFAVRNGLA